MAGQSKKVIASPYYKEHLAEILAYGNETFGYLQAKKYLDAISHVVERLGRDYTAYPECRHLATKTRMYRNIILDAHLIIYRITDKRIEILDIVHSASSIRRIRATRGIRL